MRTTLILLGVLACAACASKGSDAKNPGLGVAANGGPPAELARPPASDRLPDDLRPPR